MATLTIKNVPEKLVKRLKAQASRHRRSLNLEVIATLESVAKARPLDPNAFLARVREVRQTSLNYKLTDRTLDLLKGEGR